MSQSLGGNGLEEASEVMTESLEEGPVSLIVPILQNLQQHQLKRSCYEGHLFDRVVIDA